MRNFAICYSENAIKAADAYCLGPNTQAFLSPKLVPAAQQLVACTYKVKLSTQKQFLIRITWCDTTNLADQGFSTIGVSDLPSSPSKFTKNCRQLNKVRGTTEFQAFKSRIQVYWDLSRATYDESSGPEPQNRFYVIVLIDSEACLLLGDTKDELDALKVNNKRNPFDTKTRAARTSMVSRSEYISGDSSGVVHTTRAKFSETGTSHNVSIKCVREESQGQRGLKSSVLSVFIDKKNVIQVKRLHWNFRGNQTIFVDGLLIDMMWDVQKWLGNNTSDNQSTGMNAVFMFRTRSGLDSRLWLEEKYLERKEQDRVGFSLLICACSNNNPH